jgi:MFS family permease
VRPFRLLVLGQGVSEFGNAFQLVAVPLLLLARGADLAQLGLIASAFGVGRLATTPVAGVLVDRFGAWRIMLISDLGRLLSTAILAVLAALGRDSALCVGAIGAVTGLFAGLFMPAQGSVLPSVLSSKQLQAGNSLNMAVTFAAGLIGPSVAGFMVALAGTTSALAVDAVTFACSVATLAAIGQVIKAARSGGRAKPGMRSSSAPERSGLFALLRSSPLLRCVLAVTVVANLGLGGLNRVALPAFTTHELHVGASGLGLLIGAFAAGSLIGGLLAGALAGIRRRGRAAMLAGLLLGAAVTAVPLTGFAGALVLLLAAGLAAAVTNVLMMTTVQQATPPELLGRTMSALFFCGVGLYPLSVAAVGFLVEAYGTRVFFFLTGASLLVAFCFGLFTVARREAADDGG